MGKQSSYSHYDNVSSQAYQINSAQHINASLIDIICIKANSNMRPYLAIIAQANSSLVL